MSKMFKKLKRAESKRSAIVKAKSHQFGKNLKKVSHQQEPKTKTLMPDNRDETQLRKVQTITDTSIRENELQSFINKTKETPRLIFNRESDSIYSDARKTKKEKLTIFNVITGILILCIIMASSLLLSKYGVINPSYYEMTLMFGNRIKLVVGEVKSSFNRIGDRDSSLQDPMTLRIHDFNNKKILKELIHTDNCSLSLIPRIINSEGDNVLRINKIQNSQPNNTAIISIPLHNIIINQFSYLEFWMKKESFNDYPLNISIILHSGLSTVRYQLIEHENGWERYIIPFSDFGGIGYFSFISKLTFVIRSTGDENNTWDVYIDDIYLTKK